jgi:hypothetical protein
MVVEQSSQGVEERGSSLAVEGLEQLFLRPLQQGVQPA